MEKEKAFMTGRLVPLTIALLLSALAFSSARAGETMPHKTPVRDVEPTVADTMTLGKETVTINAGPGAINVSHDFYHFTGVQTMAGSIKLDPDAPTIDISKLPPLAYRINGRLSFGAVLNIIHGSSDKNEPLKEPTGKRDSILKLNNSDQGFGVDLGVFYELSTGTRLGVSYLSGVELQFNALPQANNLAPLPSSTLSAADIQTQSPALAIRVPQRVMMSGYHELDDHWTIMGNLGWQDWSSINRFGVGNNPDPDTQNMAAEHSYEDTWHVALGCQYKLNYDVLLTGSAAYDSSMVKDENQAADPAVGDSYRFSFGGQYNWKKILNLGLGYTFVWSGDFKIDQPQPNSNTNLSNEDNNSLHIMGANLTLQF
jgi:long-chain fatty acid transport protein